MSDRATEAVDDTDPSDVLDGAYALARDTRVRSDDAEFEEQHPVPGCTTGEVLETFDPV